MGVICSVGVLVKSENVTVGISANSYEELRGIGGGDCGGGLGGGRLNGGGLSSNLGGGGLGGGDLLLAA